MKLGVCKKSFLALAAVFMALAASVAADQPDQKGHEKRGTLAAKTVAPGQVKKFRVTAFEGKIAPSTLRVQRGDRVQITFISKDGSYSIKFPDFDINDKVNEDKPAVVEFTPTQEGTFEFRCSRSVRYKRWSKNGTLVVN